MNNKSGNEINHSQVGSGQADSKQPDNEKTVIVGRTDQSLLHKTPVLDAPLEGVIEDPSATVVRKPAAAQLLANELGAEDDDATRVLSHDHDSDPNQETAVHAPVQEAGCSPAAQKTVRNLGKGSVINRRFVIDRLLGRGGMGVVYRALDKRKQEAKDRNPFVAIKILSDEFRRHPIAFVALQREARKSQELAHPNIITVYDFDRDGEVVYLTMEQLNGLPLDKLIRENPTGLPVKQATQIIKAIAQGLSYAHSKNIVHSDLKPGNIFLTDDGTVKVLDFGIARAGQNISEKATDDNDATLFDAGELGGLTPSYASTEMFKGEEPHPSDDIYALGLICYELLTGEHPFLRERSCDVAEKGGKPAKIKSIPNYQWRAIAASLEFCRDQRIADASVFLKKYEGFSKPVLGLATALVLVVAVLGSLALFRPVDTGPEVPFDKLAPELQVRVNQALTYAQEALKFGDLNGALIHFNEAYELHPRNENAVSGLETVVEKVVDLNVDASNRSALEDKKDKIDIILKYSSLADNQKLLKEREALIKKLK